MKRLPTLIPWRRKATAIRHSPVPLNRQRASLHLAPPFLVDDDYRPRYMNLTPVQISKKRELADAHLRNCNLCPRLCGVNRYETTGFCLIGEKAKVNVIAPHFGEEPCIQGHHGSGAVFFSMCNLRCTFCQNHTISHTRNGMDLSPDELANWYMQLQSLGNVHNINLITPEHVVPQVALSIIAAAEQGLKIPIVYNTSAYDSLASLELLDGLVDIYLPDFKLWNEASAKRLLKAGDYAAVARESVAEMQRQVGDLCFGMDGIARQGVLVRHLVMPGLEEEGGEIMRWLAGNLGRDVFVNVMEQYKPDAHVGKSRRSSGKSKEVVVGGHREDGIGTEEEVRYAEINRPVTKEEIGTVRRAAEEAGIWRFCDPPKHDGFNL